MPQYDAAWCSENDTFSSQQHPQRKKRIYDAGFRASDIVLFLLVVFGERRNLRAVVARVGFLVVREGRFGDDSFAAGIFQFALYTSLNKNNKDERKR